MDYKFWKKQSAKWKRVERIRREMGIGEFGKTGELGEPGKLGTESGAEHRARFLRGEEGAVMRDMRGEEAGFC